MSLVVIQQLQGIYGEFWWWFREYYWVIWELQLELQGMSRDFVFKSISGDFRGLREFKRIQREV